jgi:hypothetical protein
MIISHNFPTTIETYTVRGKQNDFPVFDCCPQCRANNTLLRHGFYERNAIEEEACYRITICRLKCPSCGKTFSILPDFLIPYFQHTLAFMIRLLLAVWLHGTGLCSRQLRRFYEKRLKGKLTEIELFFRKLGHLEPFAQETRKKAVLFAQMIEAMDRTTFLRSWWRHSLTSPLSHSLYRGSRVASLE